MAATNHPTPVILDDKALAEIEARRPRTVHYNCPFVPLSETERDALCQTVRAAWARIEQLNALGEEMLSRLETVAGIGKKADHGWYFVVAEVERQTVALREQLAEVHDERWHTSRLLTDAENRLAQVEKERDELHEQLLRATETKVEI